MLIFVYCITWEKTKLWSMYQKWRFKLLLLVTKPDVNSAQSSRAQSVDMAHIDPLWVPLNHMQLPLSCPTERKPILTVEMKKKRFRTSQKRAQKNISSHEGNYDKMTATFRRMISRLNNKNLQIQH
jgi:hypothetical protein